MSVDDEDRHDESLQKSDQIPALVRGLRLVVLGFKAREQTADQNGGGLQAQKDDQGIDDVFVQKRIGGKGAPPRRGGTGAQATEVGDQDDGDVEQLIYTEAVQVRTGGVQVAVDYDLEPINDEMSEGDDRDRKDCPQGMDRQDRAQIEHDGVDDGMEQQVAEFSFLVFGDGFGLKVEVGQKVCDNQYE